jgi:hypothetical protein
MVFPEARRASTDFVKSDAMPNDRRAVIWTALVWIEIDITKPPNFRMDR